MKIVSLVLLSLLLVFGAAGCTPTATTTSVPLTPVPTTEAPWAATAQPTASPTAEPIQSAAIDYGQVGFDLMARDSVGPIKLGMTESEVPAALGTPDEESEAQMWGADGLKHSDWTYTNEGLTINMVESTNGESEFVAYTINAAAPCALATQKGIKIGDGKDAVLAAYGDAIDPTTVTEDSIVAGTVFGGIVFTLQDGNVTSIFLGAAAE